MWLCTLRPFPIFPMIFANDMFLFVDNDFSALFLYIQVLEPFSS